MTSSWAAPAEAGPEGPAQPPIQRPSQQPVVEAPEPLVEEPEPAAIAPAPAIEPAPADAGLPGYADTGASSPGFEPAEPILRDVPRDGRGMLTIGSLGLVGGVALGAGALALGLSGRESGIWGPTAMLASGATVAGSLFVYGGVKRRRAYRRWASEQHDVVPKQGNGLVAGGGALLIAGATAGVFGTVGWVVGNFGYDPDGSTTPPVFPAMLGVGLGSLAAGTAMMIVGMKRHERFQAWRRETGGIELTPIVAPLARGGQIGLAGRF